MENRKLRDSTRLWCFSSSTQRLEFETENWLKFRLCIGKFAWTPTLSKLLDNSGELLPTYLWWNVWFGPWQSVTTWYWLWFNSGNLCVVFRLRRVAMTCSQQNSRYTYDRRGLPNFPRSELRLWAKWKGKFELQKFPNNLLCRVDCIFSFQKYFLRV